jgi:CHASE3 domain sensor protein
MQTYVQRLEQGRQEKLRGEGADNRSFLAKYVRFLIVSVMLTILIIIFLLIHGSQWIYIVPVAIFLLISNAANKESS